MMGSRHCAQVHTHHHKDAINFHVCPVQTASAAGHRRLCILFCSNVLLSSQHVEMIELYFLFVEGILILK